MGSLSSAQAWLRQRYQNSASSSLLQAIKPPEKPNGRREKAWSLLWNTMVEFRGENIALRAAALTYITLFSLVPMLAVIFAIVSAIGQDELRRVIHEFIFTNLVPGTADELGTYIDSFIVKASSGALGVLGGFFLLVSAVTLLSNIEISLNEIWGVQKRRSFLQQGLIYWGVISLGPVVMGGSLLLSGMLRSAIENVLYIPPALFTLVPLTATVLFFAFLYIATPNARVRLVPAFSAALLGGLTFEGAKHAFAFYAVRSITYSAIYGSLGVIPLFLFWLYICWFIFLAGARFSFALQHALTGTPSDPRICDGRTREIFYVRIMLAVCANFLDNKKPPSARTIADNLFLDRAYVKEAASTLESNGLLAHVADGFVPAKPPSKITVADIVKAADSRPENCAKTESITFMTNAPTPIIDLFRESDDKSMAELEHMTLSKLVSAIAAQTASDS